MKKYAEVLNMIKQAYPQTKSRSGFINGKPVSQMYPQRSRIYTSPPPAVQGSTLSTAAQSQKLKPVQRLSPELQAYADATQKPVRATGSGSNITTISDLFARPRDNVFSSQQEKRQYFNNDPQRIAQYEKSLKDHAATRRELAKGQLYLAGRDVVNNTQQAVRSGIQTAGNAVRSFYQGVSGVPQTTSTGTASTSTPQLRRKRVPTPRIVYRRTSGVPVISAH